MPACDYKYWDQNGTNFEDCITVYINSIIVDHPKFSTIIDDFNFYLKAWPGRHHTHKDLVVFDCYF